jgi:hypothetical protein
VGIFDLKVSSDELKLDGYKVLNNAPAACTVAFTCLAHNDQPETHEDQTQGFSMLQAKSATVVVQQTTVVDF